MAQLMGSLAAGCALAIDAEVSLAGACRHHVLYMRRRNFIVGFRVLPVASAQVIFLNHTQVYEYGLERHNLEEFCQTVFPDLKTYAFLEGKLSLYGLSPSGCLRRRGRG